MKQFNDEQLWEMIDKLYLAAGRLSDLQELGADKQMSAFLNAAKRDIFDVTERLDPRGHDGRKAA
jgi:hypothetical protein